MIEVFGSEAFLQPNVEVRVTLNRSDPSFYMIQNAATKDNDYQFQITKIAYICPVVTLTDSLQPMMDGLCDESPGRYRFMSYAMKTFSIPKDTVILSIPNLFNNKVPSKMLMAIYNQNAFSGNKIDTPFLTATDFDMRSLKVLHNRLIIRDYKPTQGNNNYTEAFLEFAQFAKAQDIDFCVNKSNYMDGSTLL